MEKSVTDDFERWARECAVITDKVSGQPVPFVLNAPQRRLLSVMEGQRRAGKPVRVILLKARQWGGSTLVQLYMAWIQLCHRTGWNSVICAHLKDASAGIKGMYSRLLANYPERLRDGDARGWSFAPFEKSQSVSVIAARQACVTVASSLSPNSVRGSNLMMAHLSEVAFWGDGDRSVASAIVRSVCGSIQQQPDTLVVMESTADGRDNYFYDEWRRAAAGLSDKTPVFVPWHEIEIYRRPLDAAGRLRLRGEYDAYERRLLDEGVAEEAVAWYHFKRREYGSHEEMMAEYPSTPDEAFACRGGGSLLHGGDVPPVSDVASDAPCGEGRLVVAVALGKGERQVVSVYGAGAGGCLSPLADSIHSLSPAAFVREVARVAAAHGAGVMFAEPERGEGDAPLHGRWCARKCEETGVRLRYDERESAVVRFDSGLLAEAADVYADMAACGRASEFSACARDELLALGQRNARRYPLALSRLAAALAVSRQAAPLDACDFMP